MPIKVPNDLPAVDILTKENVFVMTDNRAMTQDIRPLHILILNLMPTKIATETQLTRLLGNTPLQVELELLHTASHKSHVTSQEHMIAFYKTFDEIRENYYDGMVVTGAPIETMPFEEVDYWEEFCRILDWTRTHVHSTLYLCWGAQAALYHFYGIEKHLLPKKLAGVYRHWLNYKKGMLFRGFDDEFYVPHSRATTVYAEDIERVPELKILSTSDEAGVFAVKSENDREIYIMGHSEYDEDTLALEYERDLKAGGCPDVPEHYYPNDDPSQRPIVRWRSCANLFYSNWLNYFVYQSTPYDIRQIREEDLPAFTGCESALTVAKFGGITLNDAEGFRRVKEIVEKDPARRYVVVSAPGEVPGTGIRMTDLLLGATGSAKKFNENMDLIQAQFQGIIDGLGVSFDLAGEMEEIRRVYKSGVAGGHYVASRGEYLCGKILAAWLGYDFVDARDTMVFGYDGQPDSKKTLSRTRAILADHARAVIPGFYGAFENRVITTFPRGGSDITGALVAEAVGADLYEKWTDVPGVLMADPKMVERPLSVPVITYAELREMSLTGSEVMHEDTVLPVQEAGIPMNIRSAFQPDLPGTVILDRADQYKTLLQISGISARSGYAGISIAMPRLSAHREIREKISGILTRAKLKLFKEISSVDALDIVVEEAGLRGRQDELLEALREAAPEAQVRLLDGLSVLAVVGREFADSPAVAAKVLDALDKARISIRFLDHAPGRISMTLGIDRKDQEEAVNVVYRAFSRMVMQ